MLLVASKTMVVNDTMVATTKVRLKVKSVAAEFLEGVKMGFVDCEDLNVDRGWPSFHIFGSMEGCEEEEREGA